MAQRRDRDCEESGGLAPTRVMQLQLMGITPPGLSPAEVPGPGLGWEGWKGLVLHTIFICKICLSTDGSLMRQPVAPSPLGQLLLHLSSLLTQGELFLITPA